MNNATVISANKELTFQEVKFLNHLRSLSTAKGYCWAGNEYFSRYYEVNERTIRRWLNKLKKLGYITREFAFKENYKDGYGYVQIVPKKVKAVCPLICPVMSALIPPNR